MKGHLCGYILGLSTITFLLSFDCYSENRPLWFDSLAEQMVVSCVSVLGSSNENLLELAIAKAYSELIDSQVLNVKNEIFMSSSSGSSGKEYLSRTTLNSKGEIDFSYRIHERGEYKIDGINKFCILFGK